MVMSPAGSLRVDRSAKTLRELALENMRVGIWNGHFKPGDRLVERQLCEQLGVSRSIVTPTLTAGIRGTGVYAEVMPNQGGRTYFCNCYGTVDMESGGNRALSESSYHQSFWGEPEERNGRFLTPAPALNHTDEELEFLARLIGQRTAWQMAGRTGVKDGRGYMEQQPASMHPAAPGR